MSAAHTKSWGTLLRPSFVSAIRLRARADRRVRHRYGPLGLLLLGETDALAGVAPVHGMLSTSGSPPGAVVWPGSGEFGTRSGVHSPVKVSSDSPPGHAAIVGAEFVGTATTATAGAAAIAIANPPASISRRAGSFRVAIITLSVVVFANRSSREKVWRTASPLHALYEFPADGSSEVVAAEAIC